MQEHCSIGLLVTTDGSITDIPRVDYIQAEKRAILDMIATGKPFLVIINSRYPNSREALAVKEYIAEEFGLDAMVSDCQALSTQGIQSLFQGLLYAFPMAKLQIHLPRWLDALEAGHPVKTSIYQVLLQAAQNINMLTQVNHIPDSLSAMEQVSDAQVTSVDLATGTVSCTVALPEALFYEILSNRTGVKIENNAQLMCVLTELSRIKKEYDQIAEALSSVNATGYGIVMPTAEQMMLEKPEIVRKNGAFGVRLKAGAPSIHMIRVDIDTEINPMVGDEKQSQDLVVYLAGEDPDKLWESNIFGKSVYTLIQDGLTSKLIRTPVDVRDKFRNTLSRVVNEGASGLICLIL